MRNVALDLGNRISFAEVLGGKCISRTVVESVEDLRPLLGPGTGRARVAIEACREAWHIHDLLEGWGHEVLLVDTTRVRELGIGHHQKKNDRIDAFKLALAVEKDQVPRAHVLSGPRRRLREQLTVRRMLVKVRAHSISEVRALLRGHGTRLRGFDPDGAVKAFEEVKASLDPAVRQLVQPMVVTIAHLDALIVEQDVALARLAQEEPVIHQLATTPGVGPVVATAFVSVIDEPHRFDDAGKVCAYLGLVPSEHTSGKRKLGSITKQGNTYLRSMLVQAAWCVLRLRTGDPLSVWGKRVLRRRGNRIAVVAVARRLAGILWALWRDGAVYEAARVGRDSADGMQRDGEMTLAVAARLREQAQSEELIQAALKKAKLKTARNVRARLAP